MVKDTMKWGTDTAKERYSASPSAGPGRPSGSGQKAIIGLIDQPMLDETGRVMQAPQAVNDEHGSGYDNDASGWVRGHGEPYPHFDKHRSGSK